MTTTFAKKAAPGGTGTAQKRIDTAHFTGTSDPLKCCFDLAGHIKPSRGRPPKRGWQKGGRR